MLKRLQRIDKDINTLHFNQHVLESNIAKVGAQLNRYFREQNRHAKKKEIGIKRTVKKEEGK